MKRIASGQEGIIFSLNDTEILKIYRFSSDAVKYKGINTIKLFYGFDHIEDLLEARFNILDKSFKSGLKVPKPLGIETISTEEIYDRCGHHDMYVQYLDSISKKNPELAKRVQTVVNYGLKKQFIPGKSLDHNFMPSLKLKHQVQKTYSDFYNQGIIIYDERPSNYVHNEEGLYYVDEGSLVEKEKMPFEPKSSTYGFHTYYGDKILFGYYAIEEIIDKKIYKILWNRLFRPRKR